MTFRAHLLGFFQMQGLLLGNSSSRSGFGAKAVRPCRAGKLLRSFTGAVRCEAARIHLQTILEIMF